MHCCEFTTGESAGRNSSYLKWHGSFCMCEQARFDVYEPPDGYACGRGPIKWYPDSVNGVRNRFFSYIVITSNIIQFCINAYAFRFPVISISIQSRHCSVRINKELNYIAGHYDTSVNMNCKRLFSARYGVEICNKNLSPLYCTILKRPCPS